jgi:hypothetical protein
MAQYAVLIFERVAAEDLPPEVMRAHETGAMASDASWT